MCWGKPGRQILSIGKQETILKSAKRKRKMYRKPQNSPVWHFDNTPKSDIIVPREPNGRRKHEKQIDPAGNHPLREPETNGSSAAFIEIE